MEGSDPDGAEPSVVPVGVVWNKESVHLQLVVADQVEGGVLYALEVVAEQVSPRQSDGKVWIRTKAHLGPVVCKERQKYKIASQCCNTTPKISKSYKAWNCITNIAKSYSTHNRVQKWSCLDFQQLGCCSLGHHTRGSLQDTSCKGFPVCRGGACRVVIHCARQLGSQDHSGRQPSK